MNLGNLFFRKRKPHDFQITKNTDASMESTLTALYRPNSFFLRTAHGQLEAALGAAWTYYFEDQLQTASVRIA